MGSRRRTTITVIKNGIVQDPAKLPKTLQALVRGVSAKDSPVQTAIKGIPGGRKAVLQLLRVAAKDDEDAGRIIEAYDRLRASGKPGRLLEDVLDDVDISPRDFIGLVAKLAFDLNLALGDTIAAFNYPKIMAMSAAVAQTAEGVDDRRMHLQHTGFVPTSKGIQIGISNKNGPDEDRPPSPGRPQSFDRTARTVVRELKP